MIFEAKLKLKQHLTNGKHVCYSLNCQNLNVVNEAGSPLVSVNTTKTENQSHALVSRSELARNALKLSLDDTRFPTWRNVKVNKPMRATHLRLTASQIGYH